MKAPSVKPLNRAQAAEAAEVFGLSLDGLEPRDVQRRFRLAIRAAHPDVGASKEEAAELIAGAREARRVLLLWLSERPDSSCKQCGGTGYVGAGNGLARPCSRCR